MNKRFYGLLIFFIALNISSAFATVIELKDGSRLSGQILSMNDGVYSVYSESVGVLKIPQSKVRAIHEDNPSLSGVGGNSKASTKAANISQREVHDIQKRILSDEHLQKSILSLRSDPQIQAILKDEELLNAIQAQDFEALSNNPKIIELMNNPSIGVIRQQLK